MSDLPVHEVPRASTAVRVDGIWQRQELLSATIYWAIHAACLLAFWTGVGRFEIALCLGLTQRADLSWATAQDVTGSLRAIDPADPVKYDFALCHRGMSGACPRRRDRDLCAPCALARECRH